MEKREIPFGGRRAGKNFEQYRLSIQRVLDLKEIIKYASMNGAVLMMTPERYEQELDKAREEGKREVYESIVFEWKNMLDKAWEELSKLNK